VSPAVVSRVYNRDASLRLRKETRATVLKAIEELGYTPHFAAQGLRNTRTRTIALVVDQATSPMFTELVAEAQRTALDAGYVVIIVDGGEVAEGAARIESMIAANRIDGLILQSGFGGGAGTVLDLAGAVPAVVVNEPAAGVLSSVDLNDEAAVRLATRHLLELGHRHLGFVATRASSSSDRRRDAFLSEVQAASGRTEGTVVYSAGWTPKQSHDAVVRLFRRGQGPTGFVSANTVLALGVLSGLAAAGFAVPADASVVAIHDTWFTQHLNPPLTTVLLPLAAMGRVAVELLIRRLNGGEPTHMTIEDPPPRLIRRNSTGRAPAARPAPNGRQGPATRHGGIIP
jgi:LacI family transcriptional regulator